MRETEKSFESHFTCPEHEMKSQSEKDVKIVLNYLMNHTHVVQVEALQRRVRTLTEETEVQAQELALWRLASQPASAVQHLLTNADDESETLRRIPAASRPEPTEEPTKRLPQTGHSQVQKNPDVVTVIREDEVSLCCSSRKLQGRLLFSR